MKNPSFSLIVGALVFSASSLSAQTLWQGASGDDWNTGGNWDSGLPTSSLSANINESVPMVIDVSAAADVQGIQKGGTGTTTIQGETLTLGAGYTGSFNSILVNGGSVVIDSNLVNTDNKRIALNSTGSLDINGNIDTGGQTTQIGNLGSGTLTFDGDRTGGNTLLFRDGLITATGILSNTGGGSTTVQSSGTLVSSRIAGPSIQSGSAGLVLSSTGTFRFGADNQIGGFLNLNGGTLDLDSRTNGGATIGNMQLNASSVIDFSDVADSSIVFSDLSLTAWNAASTLTITGFSGSDSLRFGSDSSGLSSQQLSQILFDGTAAQIDASGFVTAIPEPSAYAFIASLLVFAGVAFRRRGK